MPNEGTPARRWLRRALIAIAVIACAVLLCIGALATALRNMETGAIKSRILAAAEAQGLSLDYDEAAASLGSFRMRGLRVLQPAPDRALAPLLVIDSIDLRFNPWRALLGGRFRLEEGAIRGVHATLFTDEDGSSSITRLVARMPKKETQEKPAPLSQTLANLSRLPVSIGSFQLAGVTATAIARAQGKEQQRAVFTGLELSVSEPGDALRILLAGPAKLAVTRADAGEPVLAGAAAGKPLAGSGAERSLLADAQIELRWSQRKDDPRGELHVRLVLREQDLVSLPAVHDVLSLQAAIRPEPAQKRTTIAVPDLSLLDGAATGHLDADLADDGEGSVLPLVRAGKFEALLGKLRPFVPPAAGELTALDGRLLLDVEKLDLTHGLRFAPGGSAELHGELPRLSYRNASLAAQIDRASLALSAKPAGDEVALTWKMPVESLRASLPEKRKVALEHALLSGSALADQQYKTTAQLSASIARVHVEGAQALDAKDVSLKLAAKDAAPAPGPLRLSGALTLELLFAQLSAQANGLALQAQEASVRAPLKLLAEGSGSGEIALAIGSLSVARGGRALLAKTEAKATLQLARFAYDEREPVKSTAEAKLDFSLGATTAQLQLDKRPREATYKLTASAPTLAQARPFAGALDVPWQQIGLSLTSAGTAEHLGEGSRQSLREETTLRATGAVLHGDFEVAARDLTATLQSHGTALHHEADLALHVAGLSLQNQPRPGDENAKLHVTIDQQHPEIEAQFEATGEACPEGKLAFDLKYEEPRVHYTVDGELRHLDLVPTLLPPALLEQTQLDWSTLALGMHGEGAAEGVVTAMRGLRPVLAKEPLKSIRGAQGLDLTLQGLDYANDAGQSLVLPSAALHVKASESAAQKTLEVSAEAPQGIAGNDADEAKFEKLTSSLSVELGDQALRAELHVGLGALSQNVQPAYPIGDATFDALATAGKDGDLELQSLQFDNRAGGSVLSASGNIEAAIAFENGVPRLRPLATLSGEERDLHLGGDLVQSLDKLQAGVGASGSGSLRVPFSLDTTDFHFFRAVTGLELRDASLDFTGRHLSLSKLNARIPIKLSFRLDDGVVSPLGGARLSVYPRERFADYQPFLGEADFVTCESIRAGDSTVGPLSANLRFDRNLLALDQLELSAFGGKITGQLILDLDLAKRQLTDVQFRGDVTGLAPGQGAARSSEIVDANASLRLNPQRLELEGRIDILRVGRDDLGAMLDAWDPYHSDPSANRTRKSLAAGYPKHVRLLFHEGFTEMALEMGGIAGAAALDPIQLSTGPMLEKYAAPYLNLMKPKKKAAP